MDRPKGVSIFGYLFAISGALSIFSSLKNSILVKAMPELQKYAGPDILYWVHFLMAILFLVCGILLLKMHPKARILAIVVFLISCAASLIPLVAPMNIPPDMAKQFHTMLLIGTALSWIFDLYGIYYFTRPEIKNRFK